VTPLRAGDTLPGLVEAEDLGTYFVELRGAGQGSALVRPGPVAGGPARLLAALVH